MLFFIAAWNEPELWLWARAICLFGAASAIMYWLHLFITMRSDIARDGKHDHYSGRSFLLPLFRTPGLSVEKAEIHLHLWIEPTVAACLGLIIRLVGNERIVSTWLILAAASLAMGEAINYWASIRREKLARDVREDAEAQGEQLADAATTAPLKSTRKEPQKIRRNTRTTEESVRERRFAEVLRLLPPYRIEEAEKHYLALVKIEHPDATEQSAERNARTAELNEAIAYFRSRNAP